MKCNTCQNERYCYDSNHQLTRDGCADNGFAAYVPQTNADRIRGMSDAELAEWVTTVGRSFGEEYEGYMSALDWLKSPVEEVDNVCSN